MAKHGPAVVPKRGTGAPGPAMAALTKRQQSFVRAMLEVGGRAGDYARCALAAGFTGSPNVIRVTAHRLAHDTKVLAALKEEADKRIRSGALLGASVLLEIASDQMHKDRFRAATELLDRSGLMVITEHKVTVDHSNSSEKEMVARIADMAAQLGIDPKRLLGGYVEAEFTEVGKSDLAIPRAADDVGSTEGLEDIL